MVPKIVMELFPSAHGFSRGNITVSAVEHHGFNRGNGHPHILSRTDKTVSDSDRFRLTRGSRDGPWANRRARPIPVRLAFRHLHKPFVLLPKCHPPVMLFLASYVRFHAFHHLGTH